MGLWSDFKAFAIKGNMLDLAIGVVIGAAFGKIIGSLVSDIIMPPFGFILGRIDFKEMKYSLPPVKDLATGKLMPPVTINYGNFIQTMVEFFIVAFAIFMFVQLIERLKKRMALQKAVEEAAAPPTADVLLLTEIRDLLKEQK